MEELNTLNQTPPPLKIVNEASIARDMNIFDIEPIPPEHFFHNHDILFYFMCTLFFLWLAVVLIAVIQKLIWPGPTHEEYVWTLWASALSGMKKTKTNKCDQIEGQMSRLDQILANVFDENGKPLQMQDRGTLWDYVPKERLHYSKFFGPPKWDILTLKGKKMNILLKDFKDLQISGILVHNSNISMGNNCFVGVSPNDNFEIHMGNNAHVTAGDNCIIVTGDNSYILAGSNCTILHGANCDITHSFNCLVMPNNENSKDFLKYSKK